MTRYSGVVRVRRLTVLAATALGVLAATVVASPAARAAVQQTLYVSPTGSGTTCSAASPCSLTTARQQVRTLTASMTGDLVVSLADGTYRLSSTFALDSAAGDGGTGGHRVSYQAAAGAHPVLSGGRQVTGWTSVGGGVYRASVPAGTDTRQLYVNGTRAVRATGALPATFTRTATGYTTSNSTMATWGNIADIELVYRAAWTEPRCGIASISGTTITMKQPCFDNATKKLYGANVDLPLRVENARELLDAAGEWYLDRSASSLYYLPRPGENLTSADVEIPSLQTVVSGTGTLSAPLRNVTFSSITFAYGGWTDPNGNDGFAEVQANARMTGTNAYLNQGGCGKLGTPATSTCPYGNWTMTPANVVFDHSDGLVLSRDFFTHLGAVGLQLGQGVANTTVEGNEFTDISGSGLQVGTVSDNAPSNLAILPTNTMIDNNWVHRVGVEYEGGVGIWQGYTRTSTITHNQVNDLPYTGISSSWGWGESSAATQGNTISRNLVYDVMQVLQDGGGIYTLGPQGSSLSTGLTIDSNVVANVYDAFNNAIYDDGGSQYITLTNNVLYNDNSDWGGCYQGAGTPFGDFVYTGNYEQHATPSFGCGQPSNVNSSGNTVIAGPLGAPAALRNAAGLQSAFLDVLDRSSNGNWAAGRPTSVLFTDDSLAAMQPGSRPVQAVDGDPGSFAQASDQYRWQLLVDLQSTRSIGTLVIRQPADRYATALHVDASSDSVTWSRLTTAVGLTGGTTTLVVPSTSARFLRVVADKPDGGGQPGGQMAISDFAVYTAAAPTDLASGRAAAAQFLDGSTAAMQPNSTPGQAVDGNPSTYAEASGQYRWQLVVDLGTLRSLSQLRILQPAAAYATALHVDVSTNGSGYTTASTLTGLSSGATDVPLSGVSARYVRLVADKPDGPSQTGGEMAIAELNAFGS